MSTSAYKQDSRGGLCGLKEVEPPHTHNTEHSRSPGSKLKTINPAFYVDAKMSNGHTETD